MSIWCLYQFKWNMTSELLTNILTNKRTVLESLLNWYVLELLLTKLMSDIPHLAQFYLSGYLSYFYLLWNLLLWRGKGTLPCHKRQLKSDSQFTLMPAVHTRTNMLHTNLTLHLIYTSIFVYGTIWPILCVGAVKHTKTKLN